MLKLNLENSAVNIYHDSLKEKIEDIRKKPLPNFAKYAQNLKVIDDLTKETKNYRNIIFCSEFHYDVSSVKEIFPHLFKKNIVSCSFGDAYRINLIKKNLDPENSLLIFASQYSDVENVAALLALKEYPCILITAPGEHFLYEIARKKELTVMDMPQIEDGFYAGTLPTLLPLKIAGFPIEELLEGIKESHERFSNNSALEQNLALQAALAAFVLESRGYTEIISQFYPSCLSPLGNIYEALGNKACDATKGQTFVSSAFGAGGLLYRHKHGRKNSVLFLTLASIEDDIKIDVPKEFFALTSDTNILSRIHGKSMQELFYESLAKLNSPVLTLNLGKFSVYTVGQAIGFLHWFVKYAMWLRNV
ncbi:hypothetical protein DRJ19_00255 [Candidatus Woesearchaeota archaeon]|nr:MAG: hypothetical protein DRJ19_00255 [Candidatus Woesearchaeota archaeon]